jgi:hypothetical protein
MSPKYKSYFISFIIAIIGSIAFMTLTPLGSTNPTEFGFYWSIVSAFIISFSVAYAVEKSLKK